MNVLNKHKNQMAINKAIIIFWILIVSAAIIDHFYLGMFQEGNATYSIGVLLSLLGLAASFFFGLEFGLMFLKCGDKKLTKKAKSSSILIVIVAFLGYISLFAANQNMLVSFILGGLLVLSSIGVIILNHQSEKIISNLISQNEELLVPRAAKKNTKEFKAVTRQKNILVLYLFSAHMAVLFFHSWREIEGMGFALLALALVFGIITPVLGVKFLVELNYSHKLSTIKTIVYTMVVLLLTTGVILMAVGDFEPFLMLILALAIPLEYENRLFLIKTIKG